MASNQHTGLNPLNIPRVDATQSGINSAFATISREIAERTPRESLSAGSLQTGSGKFAVPPVAIEQVRPRHAFHAVVYMDAAASSTVKANFQAAYVIEQDDTQFPVFATEADQTVAIADGEKYWVKILVNNDYEVQSASFIQAATTTDVDPSPTSNGEIYKLCVEFDEDAAGKIVVTYHRFDSINYRPASTSTSGHPWKATSNGDATVDVAAGIAMGWAAATPAGDDTLPPYFHLKEIQSYVGGSVTVTASGKIYGKIPFTQSGVYQSPYGAITNYSTRLDPSGSLTVAFGETVPTSGDSFYFEIATVSISDGVAGVDSQILTHNPTLAQFYGFFAP